MTSNQQQTVTFAAFIYETFMVPVKHSRMELGQGVHSAYLRADGDRLDRCPCDQKHSRESCGTRFSILSNICGLMPLALGASLHAVILRLDCRSLSTTCLSRELPQYAAAHASYDHDCIALRLRSNMLLLSLRPLYLFHRSLPLPFRRSLPRRLISLRILDLGSLQPFQNVPHLFLWYPGGS